MILLPDATLQFRPDLGTIVVRWSDESSNQALIQVYTELFEIAKKRNCFNWLLDVRRRNHIDNDFVEWFYVAFLDAVCACKEIATDLKIAFVVSPIRTAIIKEFDWQPYLKHFGNNHSCYVNSFDCEKDAYKWLGIHS